MVRKGVSVAFHGGMWQRVTVVLWCRRGKEIRVWEVQSGSWDCRWDREGTNGFMAWEGTEVWGASPEVSPVRRFSRRAEELFQKVPGETEGEPSVWGEGQGTDTPGPLWQQRTLESPCGLSAWGAFLLRVQPGGVSEGEEGTQDGVWCLCQAPLPVPVTAVAVQRGQRLAGSSCTAARQPC